MTEGRGVSGGEQDLHEIVIAGDECPVLVASPVQDHLVVSAGEADLRYVHHVVPGCLQVRADPIGDVLIRRVRFLWCAMRFAPAFWCYLNWCPDVSWIRSGT